MLLYRLRQLSQRLRVKFAAGLIFVRLDIVYISFGHGLVRYIKGIFLKKRVKTFA